MVEIDQVVQDYRTGFWMARTRVLDQVSFTIPQGSVFGFLGANGAGKTTLIQLMVGLRQPTKGSIRIQGVSTLRPEARLKLGYLPERPYFYSHLTAEKFLEFYGTLSGLEGLHLKKRIGEVLEQTGMTDARKKELGKFSKGMLQRIGIAQAILHEPELLVLDEPMSGLDPVGRKEIRELVQGLAKTGTTIFFSTHVIPDIEMLCDRVAMIQRGKLVHCGKIEDLLKDQADTFEVQVRGVTRALAEKWTATEIAEDLGQVLKLNVKGSAAVQSVLAQNEKAGGYLLSVVPARGSLEDLFGSRRSGGALR